MRGQPGISGVYRLGEPSSDQSPEIAFGRMWKLCRDMWRLNGTIVAKPDELPESLKQGMEEWANEQYGPRKQKNKRH